MASRVGLTKISMTHFDWPTPKTSVRCKNLGPILNASWIMVNFVWKFPNFCYHGNRGSLTQISLSPLNRPTPKTPYLVQESLWYLLYKLSNGRFCVQITSACCHGNIGGLTEIWMIPLDCPTPKTPCLVQTSCTYLTVPELWLFKFAICRSVNFQIVGAKGGKFQFFLTKPYKECECHQNASFKPLTTIIGQTGGSVAMRMKLKNLKT